MLKAIAILHVRGEVADILCSIAVDVVSATVRPAFLPLAPVGVTFMVQETAETVRQVLIPLTLVLGAILPDLHTITLS